MRLGFNFGFGPTGQQGVNEPPVLDISSFSNVPGNAYDYSGGSSRIREMAINDDGTRLLAMSQNNDRLLSYTLSTGWDLSTITKDATEVTMATLGDGETNPQGLEVKPDGAKLYYNGFTQDTVFQYSMSTPWDLSTLSADSKSFALEGNSICFAMSANGEHLYAVGAVTDPIGATIIQYDLSTPWDVSTASSSGKSFVFTGLGPGPMWISDDGTKLVLTALAPDVFRQYSFGTPWDISTLVYDDILLDYASETTDTHAGGVLVKSDFSTLIMSGGTTTFLYQLS